MSFLLVLNPTSGGLDKTSFREHLDSLVYRFNLPAKILETQGDGEDEKRIREEVQRNRPDRIAAIGGDGTVRMVALSILEEDLPMGIIPMGSANGLARELGLPADPFEALNLFFLSRSIKKVDLLLLNNIPCLHFGDIGINAEMVRLSHESGDSGMTGYAKQLTNILPGYQPFDLEVETDQGAWKGKAYQVAIANARRLGTGVVFNPSGLMDDGAFEVVIIRDFTAKGLLHAGLTAIDEEMEPDYGDDMITLSGTKATVKLGQEKTIQLDGEPIGKTSLVEARIRPQALSLILQRNKERS